MMLITRLETLVPLRPPLGGHCGTVQRRSPWNQRRYRGHFFTADYLGSRNRHIPVPLASAESARHHEDDQIFLDAAEEHMARKQRS